TDTISVSTVLPFGPTSVKVMVPVGLAPPSRSTTSFSVTGGPSVAVVGLGVVLSVGSLLAICYPSVPARACWQRAAARLDTIVAIMDLRWRRTPRAGGIAARRGNRSIVHIASLMEAWLLANQVERRWDPIMKAGTTC